MFGKLVDAGQAGFIFEKETDPTHYLKVVALGGKPLKSYGLDSLTAKLYAINQNQARLFYQLYRSGSNIPQLPKVYAFYTGKVNTVMRRAFLENDSSEELNTLLKSLPVGQKIAVWEMEKIPCLTENDFCQMYEDKTPQNNPDYQNLLEELLNMGFVVRDIANPDNFGFRHDGTQVFYDPVVAPWPVSEATLLEDPNRYAAFVAAFSLDQIPTIHGALNNGDYFTWYHGGGILEAEDTTEDWRFEQGSEMGWVGALNWWASGWPHGTETFKQMVDEGKIHRLPGPPHLKDAYKFWQNYYDSLWEVIQEVQYENPEFPTYDLWGELTPNNVQALILQYLEKYGGFELISREDLEDHLSELVMSSTPMSVIQANQKPGFLRWIRRGQPIKCVECGGSGEQTILTPDDQYEIKCEDCEGTGETELLWSDNKWAKERPYSFRSLMYKTHGDLK